MVFCKPQPGSSLLLIDEGQQERWQLVTVGLFLLVLLGTWFLAYLLLGIPGSWRTWLLAFLVHGGDDVTLIGV